MAGPGSVSEPRVRSVSNFRTLFALAGAVVAGCAPPDPPPNEWTSLFNGRDLTGWTAKIRGEELGSDPWNTFRVDEGLLTVGYEEYESFDRRFGHLFHETPHSSYRLRVEYRFIGDQVAGGPGWAFRNSGVMFHAQDPASMGVDQDFPVSLEAQFLGGNGEDPRPTANLCTPGTHVEIDGVLVTDHCITADAPTYHGDQWVTVELEVHGDSVIHHLIEGDTVLTYQRPVVGGGEVNGYDAVSKPAEGALRGGFLALQSESHPIQFRRVELQVLDGSEPRH